MRRHPGTLRSPRYMRSRSLVLIAAVALSLVIWESAVRSFFLRGSAAQDGQYSTDSDVPRYTPYHVRGAAVSSRTAPREWHIAIVSDLDKASRDPHSKPTKPSFFALYKRGVLSRGAGAAGKGNYAVTWTDEHKLKTGHNEKGRGMELSELQWYRGALYTMDDRTGLVYRIEGPDSSKPTAYPTHILMAGDGRTDKGQKTEWATVKDDKLYIGSYGKEWTDYVNGKYTVIKSTNLWVSTIDAHGSIEHLNWVANYNALRKAGNGAFPGYMVQEAFVWSPVWRKWFVLPRRASPDKYDEKADERMGTNMLLIADEDFSSVQVKHIGQRIPTHGFSTAKFVPGTNDEVMVAIKSEEVETKGVDGASAKYESRQTSFITVFNWRTGDVLLDETEIPGKAKFEGIEFI